MEEPRQALKQLEDNSPPLATPDVDLLCLPIELLLKVFSYLGVPDLVLGVRRTCLSFYQLSFAPELWKHVTVDFYPDDVDQLPAAVSDYFYPKLLHQSIHKKDTSVEVKDVVTCVEERGTVTPSCSVLHGMVYPNLRKLKLLEYELPRVEFLSRYSALLYLHMDFSTFDQQQQLDEKIIEDCFAILKNLTKLQTLTFICTTLFKYKPNDSVCQSIRDYFLMGPKLRSIELDLHVNAAIVGTIVDHCSELQHLVLDHADIESGALLTVSKKPSVCLSALRLRNCAGLDDRCLNAIALGFPSLKTIELTLNAQTTDQAMGCLLRACSQLTNLDVTSPVLQYLNGKPFSERCMYELTHNEGKLQSLCLKDFVFPDASIFTSLCQCQRNLRLVELKCCKVTSNDIITMARSCPLLEDVQLVHCPDVGATAMSFLIRNLPRLRNLRCQSPDGNLCLTENTCPAIETGLPHRESGLQTLKIGCCRDVTLAGMSALTSLCPNLLILHVTVEDHTLDDSCLQVILRKCSVLREFNIQHLPQWEFSGRQGWLSDYLVNFHLIERLGLHLRSLTLPFTSQTTTNSLAKTLFGCPQLRHVYFHVNLFDWGMNYQVRDVFHGFSMGVQRDLQSLQTSRGVGEMSRVTGNVHYFEYEGESEVGYVVHCHRSRQIHFSISSDPASPQP